MDLEKSFLKTFLGKFKGVSFNVEFWDGDEVKVGEDNPKFKIILHKPLKKKDILTSTTLAFGEAYMKGDIEIEGDLFTVFDELLKCIDEFSTNFGALTKIFGGATSKKKQKEEVSVAASIANSSAQDKRNAKQGSHYNHPEPDSDQDFSIHSVEEARRAIIWGEILQRKY